MTRAWLDSSVWIISGGIHWTIAFTPADILRGKKNFRLVKHTVSLTDYIKAFHLVCTNLNFSKTRFPVRPNGCRNKHEDLRKRAHKQDKAGWKCYPRTYESLNEWASLSEVTHVLAQTTEKNNLDALSRNSSRYPGCFEIIEKFWNWDITKIPNRLPQRKHTPMLTSFPRSIPA